jgi:hypothetical protein
MTWKVRSPNGRRWDSGRVGPAVPAGPTGDGSDGDLYVADIAEVVVTRLNSEATLLMIESWTPHRGLRVVERE